MSGVWEFVKRHKGKILAGSAILGGALAVQQVRQKKQHEPAYENDAVKIQAHRHYVFDSNQRSCDESITALAPEIAKQIAAKLNVDAITKELHEGNLSLDKKIELWNELKTVVFSRILSLAYCYSILTVTLKAQISILVAEICSQFECTGGDGSWWMRLSSSLWNGQPQPPQVDVSSRQVFLRSIQYFTLTGAAQLCTLIGDIVREHMSSVPLDETLDTSSLQCLLNSISTKIYDSSPDFLVKFVAPHQREDDEEGVFRLLSRLNAVLLSPEGGQTVAGLVDFYCSSAIQNVSTSPLARQLGPLSQSFDRISSVASNSPLENSLFSSDVHKFAMFAFNYRSF